MFDAGLALVLGNSPVIFVTELIARFTLDTLSWSTEIVTIKKNEASVVPADSRKDGQKDGWWKISKRWDAIPESFNPFIFIFFLLFVDKVTTSQPVGSVARKSCRVDNVIRLEMQILLSSFARSTSLRQKLSFLPAATRVPNQNGTEIRREMVV